MASGCGTAIALQMSGGPLGWYGMPTASAKLSCGNRRSGALVNERHQCVFPPRSAGQPPRAPFDSRPGSQWPSACRTRSTWTLLGCATRWREAGNVLTPGVYPCGSPLSLSKHTWMRGGMSARRIESLAIRRHTRRGWMGSVDCWVGDIMHIRNGGCLGNIAPFRSRPAAGRAAWMGVRCVQGYVSGGRERGEGREHEAPNGRTDFDQPLVALRQFLGSPLAKVALVVCVSLVLGRVFGGRSMVSADVSQTGRAVSMSFVNIRKGVLAWAVASWPNCKALLGLLRDQGPLLTVLLILSAFFACAETSITTLWPWKVRELAEKEAAPGGVFTMLRSDVTRFLTTALIGSTATNIAATALVTDAVTHLFGEAGVGASTGVMTVVILLLTEIAPKSIAVHNAVDVARVVIRPVAWFSIILYPVGRVCTIMSMWLLKAMGLKSTKEPFVTEEELKLVLSGAEMSGAIEEEEQDMIENVLELEDTPAREVMTPLVDVVAIDADATLIDLRNMWVRNKYSRVPVFEKRVDNIVGIVYAMDMLDYVEQVDLMQTLTVGRIARKPAYFVPDSMSFWTLLREFRIRKVHMAIVVNEYGGTAGLVTLEDVVEEIVGEIYDENDSKEEIRKRAGYVIQIGDGIYDVDANTSVEDLEEEMGVKVPEGTQGPPRYETVSGLVCETFGYIPRVGEVVEIALEHGMRDSEERNGGEDKMGGGGEGANGNAEARPMGIVKYRLKVLSGNVRKVGSVRFERIQETKVAGADNRWGVVGGGREKKGGGSERHRWHGHHPGSTGAPSVGEVVGGEGEEEEEMKDLQRGNMSSLVDERPLIVAGEFIKDEFEDGYGRNLGFAADNDGVDRVFGGADKVTVVPSVRDGDLQVQRDAVLDPITSGEALRIAEVSSGSLHFEEKKKSVEEGPS